HRRRGRGGAKPARPPPGASTGEARFATPNLALRAVGFDLAFRKPVDRAAAGAAANYAVKSFTYVYHSTYGCPEMDTRAEKVRSVKVSADGKALSLAVPGLRKGRVYELRLAGVKSAAGDEVLHPEAYYTLNELVE